MSHALKWLIGILLLPFAAAATLTFAHQVQVDLDWQRLDVTTWWFIGGFVVWLLLYFLLPRPMWTYVLGHELTHAIWGLIMGAKVSRLKVSERGGSVTLTKSNILITLAPYFFPFYTVVTLIVYLVAGAWLDMTTYQPFWYAIFGLTWSFHLTFTLSMLSLRQPDILEHGRLFSYTLIYCINLLTAAVLMNLLTDRPIASLGPSLRNDTLTCYQYVWDSTQPVLGYLKAKW